MKRKKIHFERSVLDSLSKEMEDCKKLLESLPSTLAYDAYDLDSLEEVRRQALGLAHEAVAIILEVTRGRRTP